MNDKNLNEQRSIPERLDTQWVMVFNLITGQGRDEIKKTYKVNKKRLVIGSALSSDIRIQQNAVSNVHCVVEMDENGQAHVFDMASETGVFLNGKKILSEDLKDGDELKVGFATLTYRRQQVSEAQAQAPAGAVRASASGGRKLFYDTQEDFRPLILEDERDVIQIFDYPSSAEQALQVVMYWGDVILDVKHLVDNKDVTLGEGKDATFPVPGFPSAFPLVTFEGAAQLHFTQNMTGVVRSGKQLMPLDQVSGGKFHLKNNDLAKIEFKDISFYVSYSPVPPHLKRQRVLERDPLYTRIWFTSILLTLAIVLLLVGIEPPKKLETEELPPRVATIIFKQVPPPPPPPPPKPEPVKEEVPKPMPPPPMPMPMPPPPMPQPMPMPPPEPPKPVPPPMVMVPPQVTKPQVKPIEQKVKGAEAKPAGGNAGEGARMRGAEGQAGNPNKPKNAPPMNTGGTKGGPARAGSASAVKNQSQVKGPGNVEALFSDIGGNIAKNLAGGGAKGAGAAGGALRQETGPIDTGGAGLGTGLTGSGSGGGGTALTGGGLGNKGTGFGAEGAGNGRLGSGGDLMGSGHGRPNVDIGNASETIIMGGLDKSVIDEYIRRHMRQIRNCYEKELSGSQGLAGRIATRFVISGSGRVTQAGVSSSSMGNSNVESCLIGVLKRIVFPEPLGGGIVEVDYPFSFSATK
jgi:hypothetical protein